MDLASLRNIGVAVGNRLLGTSQPLTILKAKSGQPNWSELEALVQVLVLQMLNVQ